LGFSELLSKSIDGELTHDDDFGSHCGQTRASRQAK
jgi:hypothetical protein